MDKSTQKRGRQQVCSFCGKGQGQVKHLIAGPDAYAGTPVYICDECVFKFAGDRKNKYIQTVLWALMGVIFSLLPYVIMGKMVRQLLEGERNFAIYLSLAGMMALCWVMRVAFHTVSTSAAEWKGRISACRPTRA